MYTKEDSKIQIQKLVTSFEEKLDYIKTSGKYKEAQIEDEFIKPLFKYLNWNISNEGIDNPNEREFIVQASIGSSSGGSRASTTRKEPDYLLQTNGERKFYIEIYKPPFGFPL